MEVIEDLLEKRGNIYSHRPVFTVVSELMGLGRVASLVTENLSNLLTSSQSMALLPYGTEWREQRKLAHVALNPGAVKEYIPIQEEQSTLLNKALLEDPDDFFAHVRLYG